MSKGSSSVASEIQGEDEGDEHDDEEILMALTITNRIHDLPVATTKGHLKGYPELQGLKSLFRASISPRISQASYRNPEGSLNKK